MSSSTVTRRYSRGFSPALRTVRVALGKCLPLQQASIRSGLALSMYLVNDRSCTLHLPAPAPPPTCALPELEMPQDQARTSISSLWTLSRDSPFSSPILMNMSIPRTQLPPVAASLRGREARAGGQPPLAWPYQPALGPQQRRARAEPSRGGLARTRPGTPAVTGLPCLGRLRSALLGHFCHEAHGRG